MMNDVQGQHSAMLGQQTSQPYALPYMRQTGRLPKPQGLGPAGPTPALETHECLECAENKQVRFNRGHGPLTGIL